MTTRKLKSLNARETEVTLNQDLLKCQRFKFKIPVNSWPQREETINIHWNYWTAVIAVLTMLFQWMITWNVSQITLIFCRFLKFKLDLNAEKTAEAETKDCCIQRLSNHVTTNFISEIGRWKPSIVCNPYNLEHKTNPKKHREDIVL